MVEAHFFNPGRSSDLDKLGGNVSYGRGEDEEEARAGEEIRLMEEEDGRRSRQREREREGGGRDVRFWARRGDINVLTHVLHLHLSRSLNVLLSG